MLGLAFLQGMVMHHDHLIVLRFPHREPLKVRCKNALERGVTATLGSVGEPYLDAFPEPARFMTLLLTGKYSLVEAYYLTSRYVSWRMVLFGDPLYNPMQGRSRPTADSPTPFPTAPSDRPLGDPPARLAQKH